MSQPPPPPGQPPQGQPPQGQPPQGQLPQGQPHQAPPQQPGQQNPYATPVQPPPKEGAPPSTQGASALDMIVPTNPLAVISCYLGIFAIITCFGGLLLGPIAILLGVLGLRAWKVQESQYGKTMSSVRAWIGIVTGVIATVLGLVAIVIAILNMSGSI